MHQSGLLERIHQPQYNLSLTRASRPGKIWLLQSRPSPPTILWISRGYFYNGHEFIPSLLMSYCNPCMKCPLIHYWPHTLASLKAPHSHSSHRSRCRSWVPPCHATDWDIAHRLTRSLLNNIWWSPSFSLSNLEDLYHKKPWPGLIPIKSLLFMSCTLMFRKTLDIWGKWSVGAIEVIQVNWHHTFPSFLLKNDTK